MNTSHLKFVICGVVGFVIGDALIKGVSFGWVAPLPEPFFHEGATRLDMRRDAPRQTEAAQAYSEWLASDDYFSAFATDSKGNFGWVREYNSLEMAERGALAYCEQGDGNCQIVAVRVPDIELPADREVIGSHTNKYYQEYLTLPGYRAFATAEDGSTGWSWDYDNRAEAAAAAMSFCEEWRLESDQPLPFSTCKVIHVAP
ncbi:hypothetical protein SLH49_20125 [Cognatiyoonia sp. IB215446]|uniref:hypothetical protein n=1 Tax=Cognatiyoonia sp. IB215446 TaxID=3097355 RepID=UPI002A11BBC5|nr:hypothetical protein [Cognatiyoonia sp. IB215446]MDX8350306.1 hypothetical protein [Cognatiyoonia sp. IB215446]